MDYTSSVTNTTTTTTATQQYVQGYLYKKGAKSFMGRAPQYKKRWFILIDNQLKYYKNAIDLNTLLTTPIHAQPQPQGIVKMELVDAVQQLGLNSSTTNSSTSSSSSQSGNSIGGGNTPRSSTSSSSSSQQWSLALHTKERIYHLYAQSETEMIYWVNNLSNCIIGIRDPSASPQQQQQQNQQSQQTPPIETRSRSNTTPVMSVSIPSTPPIANSGSNINVNQNRNSSNNVPLKSSTSSTNSSNNGSSLNISSTSINNTTTSTSTPTTVDKNGKLISKSGVSIADKIKNHSSGYITAMVAVTNNKIWTGDSQGNIVTWGMNRVGEDREKVKKGSQWKPHGQSVTSLIYVAAQKTVYSSSLDGKICAWNKSDFTLIFSHTSTTPIYDCVPSKYPLLLYTAHSENSVNSLVIFDTVSQTTQDIPLNSVIQSLVPIPPVPPAKPFKNSHHHHHHHHSNGKSNNTANGNISNRKFNKILRVSSGLMEKLILVTSHCELLVWSPWDSEQVCQLVEIGYQGISACQVIGNNLWICSIQEHSSGLFSTTLPCIISVYNIDTLERISSFECGNQPITCFYLINGFVWAINRNQVFVYQPNTGQFIFENIDLQDDMNYCILYNNDCAWVGGNYLYRFLVHDNWIQSNQIDFNPDLSNWDYLDKLLKKLKNRLKINHSNQLFDLILDIGESDLLTPLSNTIIEIVKTLRLFARNNSYVTNQIYNKDLTKLIRISRLLNSYLNRFKSDYSIIYETLKSIKYFYINFEKYFNYVPIDIIIKYSLLPTPVSIIKESLMILVKYISQSKTLPHTLINYVDTTQNVKGVKGMVKLIILKMLNNNNVGVGGNAIIKQALIQLIQLLYDKDNRIKEMIKKEKYLSVMLTLSKITPPTFYSIESLKLVQLIIKDYPKILDVVGKLGGITLDGGNQLQQQNTIINETSVLILQLTSPTVTPMQKKTFRESASALATQVVASSPVGSLIFTLNSILHSVQNTALKSAKVTIKEINLPEEFDPFQDRQSIIQLSAIFPRNCFEAQIAIELAPKDLRIKLAIELKGFISGEATISDVNLKGLLTLGFEHGTSIPLWISFKEEPKINFKCQTTGLFLKPIDIVIKPALSFIIKSKLVHPNKLYLPNF